MRSSFLNTTGWYYYLDDKIRFPFQAKCTTPNVVSPLQKGETVEVLRMAPEDACAADMLVLIQWQGREMTGYTEVIKTGNPRAFLRSPALGQCYATCNTSASHS